MPQDDGSTDPTKKTDAPVRPGEVLAGKYSVDRVLGVGGMGVVVPIPSASASAAPALTTDVVHERN